MSYIGTAFTADVANAGAINKLLQSVGAMTAFFITPLFGRHTADPQSYLYEVRCAASYRQLHHHHHHHHLHHHHHHCLVDDHLLKSSPLSPTLHGRSSLTARCLLQPSSASLFSFLPHPPPPNRLTTECDTTHFAATCNMHALPPW